MIAWLVRLLNCCFETGRVPRDRCRACIIPLYKGNGDRCDYSNSRGVGLLGAEGKQYGRVLIGRIRSRTDDVLREKQCGFRCDRGCVDQLFVVRQLCDKFLAKGKDLFWAFMDL